MRVLYFRVFFNYTRTCSPILALLLPLFSGWWLSPSSVVSFNTTPWLWLVNLMKRLPSVHSVLNPRLLTVFELMPPNGGFNQLCSLHHSDVHSYLLWSSLRWRSRRLRSWVLRYPSRSTGFCQVLRRLGWHPSGLCLSCHHERTSFLTTLPPIRGLYLLVFFTITIWKVLSLLTMLVSNV